MCVPETAVIQEFGPRAAHDGCREIAQGPLKFRYCLCSTSGCNRQSVLEQMIAQSNQQMPDRTPRPHQPPMTFTSTSAFTPSSPGRTELQSFDIHGSMSCVVCQEGELASPTLDCMKPTVTDCTVELHGAQPFCLTQQSQHGSFFTVEKRCISEEQFHKEFPEENGMFDPSSQSTHCASTFDGSVNYCICATDMCNVLSLVDQADQGRTRSGVASTPSNNMPRGFIATSTEPEPTTIPRAFESEDSEQQNSVARPEPKPTATE
ncbi:Protein R11F4.3 [Aphelenchoides avenae]|nr:Protein R11F4.3 [Aphelenchus avenae]